MFTVHLLVLCSILCAVMMCRRILKRNRLRALAEKSVLARLWDKVSFACHCLFGLLQARPPSCLLARACMDPRDLLPSLCCFSTLCLAPPPPLAFPLPVALAHFPLTCNLSFLQVDADRVRVVASVARNNAIAADLAESERKSSRRSRGCVHLCRCFDVLLNPSLIAFALLRAGLMHGPPCQLGPLAQGRKK